MHQAEIEFPQGRGFHTTKPFNGGGESDYCTNWLEENSLQNIITSFKKASKSISSTPDFPKSIKLLRVSLDNMFTSLKSIFNLSNSWVL